MRSDLRLRGPGGGVVPVPPAGHDDGPLLPADGVADDLPGAEVRVALGDAGGGPCPPADGVADDLPGAEVRVALGDAGRVPHVGVPLMPAVLVAVQVQQE